VEKTVQLFLGDAYARVRDLELDIRHLEVAPQCRIMPNVSQTGIGVGLGHVGSEGERERGDTMS
jgi:hypothetical protein